MQILLIDRLHRQQNLPALKEALQNAEPEIKQQKKNSWPKDTAQNIWPSNAQ